MTDTIRWALIAIIVLGFAVAVLLLALGELVEDKHPTPSPYDTRMVRDAEAHANRRDGTP